MRGRFVAWTVALALCRAAGAEELAVRSIVVRSEEPIAAGTIAPLIAIEVGEALTAERVRRTLRNVRLAGLASDVEVRRRERDGGLEVELVLRPEVRVAGVSIEGRTGLPVERLAALLPQKDGAPLREDAVLRGVYRLQDELAGEGWIDASVRLDVRAVSARSVSLVYRVEAGSRWRIGEVEISGLGELPFAEAVAALRSRPGEPFRPAELRDDADRLKRFLVRRGRRTAQVSPASEQRRREAAAVDLAFDVEAGPRFDFELVGASRKALEKKGLLPFLGDDGFDEAVLQQSLSEIRREFQQRGHYRVVVNETRRQEADRVQLRLEVVPGPRYRLEEVILDGDLTFERQQLERLLGTAPRRLLSLERSGLVDEVLAEDQTNLRSFYALQGFDRAAIGPARVEELGGERLRVVIPIAEGPRRVTGSVDISGLTALDEGELAAELALAPGGPFHSLHLDASADVIRRRLEELGYRSAIVESEVTWDDEQHVANVVFRVLEGARSTADVIVVRGNTRTRSRVVRRFLALERGDPISTEGLLDVQRSLYRLGIFSRVDVRVPTADAEFAASEVVVELEEGNPRAVAYGAGYDSESGARGLLRFSHANLGGRAASFQVDALVAQRDQLYRALYRQPYLGAWPVEARALAYSQIEDRPTFDVARRGAQLGLERSFGRLRAGLYAEYRLVELETDAPPEVIPRESRNARVASLSPTLLWDRRDDPVDPRRGWSLAVQAERALPIGAADADFEKLFVQATGLLPAGRGVVAASLRAGGLRPRAAPLDPTLRPIDAVPAAELYYAGGRTSHRAFARDELGIPGETLFVAEGEDPVPLGGGVLVLVNLEWRFPLVGAFGGDLFVDGGNVWREIGDFDPGDARWGAGVGLRYASPIGPLRLEVGWKLDREPFEDPFVWFISLGNAF